MNKILVTTILLLLSTPWGGRAQEAKRIEYSAFLDSVYAGNMGYALAKLNVNLADAAVVSAKVFSDPTLSVEYGYNQDKTLQMGQGVTGTLGKTISFGKREAGIELASSEKSLSEALLNDYLRHLKAEASIAYFTAVYQKELLLIEEEALRQLRALATGDSLRLAIGDIAETTAIQTRLEAGMAQNTVRDAQEAYFNAQVALGMMLGYEDDLYRAPRLIPVESLSFTGQAVSLPQVMETALANRADLEAALQQVDVAQKSLLVARRERRTDVDFTLGVNYNTRVRNQEAPAPPFTGVTVGLGIPLKFSNLNKGTLQAEAVKVSQAETALKLARQQVGSEVVMAYNTYCKTVTQLESFDNGMLEDAKTVMDSMVSAYAKGNCSLLEVLNAQRTYNDIRRSYLETVYNGVLAQIQLRFVQGYD